MTRGRYPLLPGEKTGHSNGHIDKIWKSLNHDGEVRGPELPDPHTFFAPGPLGDEWHPFTVVWYEAMRRSPMSKEYLEIDWLSLIECAVTHHLWCHTKDLNMQRELRMRMGNFGVGPADRLRLRWTVEQPGNTIDAAPNPDVPSLDERRNRLTGTT